MAHLPIDTAKLVTHCDPESLGFALTSEVKALSVVVGQERAVEAIKFGIEVKQSGYNLFVTGPTGSGRSRIVQSYLEQQAATQPIPNDYCYVHNFDDPRRPRALALLPGWGTRLRDQLNRLVDELQAAIPAAFESTNYRERREAIEREIAQRHEQELEKIAQDAQQRGVAVVRTPTGIVLAPLHDGEVLNAEQQEKLDPSERARLAHEAETVQERLQATLARIPVLQREQRERVKQLDQDVTRAVAHDLLAEVRRAFAEHQVVLDHVQAIERDILDKASYLLRPQGAGDGMLAFTADGMLPRDNPILRRYCANLVVDHRISSGAPVIELGHPTSGQLVGKVEHASQLGVLVTDFKLIKSGALHRASGGYLVIDARRLLSQPVAYEQLKRTLREGAIRIESVPEALDLTMGVSLEPEPIPFTGKVVLIGESWLYQRLCALDPELSVLFKVAADFETDMRRTAEGSRAYAQLLSRVLQSENLLPMRAAAVARLIDFAARIADDSTRLSMHMGSVFDVLREAHHLALSASREVVEREDVQRALDAQDRRSGRLRERVHEALADGTIRVATQGGAVGQINGLSVVQLATTRFGFPTRISARVRLGKGEVLDIERDVEMSGPIHSKGVLILGAVLGSRYLVDQPLSLHASLAFEQSYGGVDGDSASLAELLALLSAIGEFEISQSLAVTGSLDQHGHVQAVGGLNEKIEGFFDVCKLRGDKGPFGVVIPAVNVRHLMLRDDLVVAAERGEFHVYAVEDVDQALSLVTGLVAGSRTQSGPYEEGSANRRVEDRLDAFGKAAIALARAAQADKPKP